MIAVIPARMGSVGFKFKNRKFFANTANFLDESRLFGKIIVSTDDPKIKAMAQERNYVVHDRSETLAGPAVAIKAVFEEIILDMRLLPDEILWLFYLPVLYKNRDDFDAALEVATKPNFQSLLSFTPVKVHPYSCWFIDPDTNKLKQFIPNDIFRRQDMNEAWSAYHYLCAFRAGALPGLNNELVGQTTTPIFLSEETRDRLIEIDTPEDYERWKKLQQQQEKDLGK